jgi:hypothetical protein
MAGKKKKIKTWAQLQSAKSDLKKKHEEEQEALNDEENDLYNEVWNAAKDMLDAARVEAFNVLVKGMSTDTAGDVLKEILKELYQEDSSS